MAAVIKPNPVVKPPETSWEKIEDVENAIKQETLALEAKIPAGIMQQLEADVLAGSSAAYPFINEVINEVTPFFSYVQTVAQYVANIKALIAVKVKPADPVAPTEPAA